MSTRLLTSSVPQSGGGGGHILHQLRDVDSLGGPEFFSPNGLMRWCAGVASKFPFWLKLVASTHSTTKLVTISQLGVCHAVIHSSPKNQIFGTKVLIACAHSVNFV
jgi:hypothetical protein